MSAKALETPIELSLTQASALARLADRAGEGWLLGPQPLTDDLRRDHTLGVWHDGELMHVLLQPPGEWLSVDRTGKVVATQNATRAEVLTVALRASTWWAGMRRLLGRVGDRVAPELRRDRPGP